MAEIPMVVVDVQRAGPSTGMPTKVSQGDLRISVFGAHDDAPRIVVAPVSVVDNFYEIINAFNLAEKYQTPVIFLSDQDMSVRVQTIPDAMSEHQLRRIPIVDNDGRVVGIIAQADVATRVNQPEKTAAMVKEISQSKAN